MNRLFLIAFYALAAGFVLWAIVNGQPGTVVLVLGVAALVALIRAVQVRR